jgi:hypothetical protein
MWAHASELGFTQVDVMRKKALLNLLHMTQDSQYNKWYADAYYFPVYDVNKKLFQTWAGVKAALLPANRTRTTFSTSDDSLEAGFQLFLLAAASLLSGQSISDVDSSGSGTITGDNAWAWVSTNVRNKPNLYKMPKWALIPRIPSVSRAVSCDLNGDGRVDVLDVQMAVRQALGLTACNSGDLDSNGTCDVRDVQIIVNAVLYGTCSAQ